MTPSDGVAATVSAGDGRPTRGAGSSAAAGPAAASAVGRAVEPDPADPHRTPTFVLAALLLVAGILVGLSPALGIVGTADGSPTTTATAAAFVAVLPGLLALVLSGYRTLGGLAATAGAGVIGLVRLLTDLGVVTAADSISRPELFAETTEQARPFTVGPGAWLLVVADLLWLAVGVLAAMRLAGATSLGAQEQNADVIFGGSGSSTAGPADRVGTDRQSTEVPGPDFVVDSAVSTTVVGQALSRRESGERALNLPMVCVGFVGAVLLMVGALGTPFTGGYLNLRVLPFGSSMSGLVAAALVGFLTAIVVLVAGALPRALAQALLAGTALAAGVPSLTAVVAVLTGAPTGLSPIVWCGVLGASIVAAAGLLAGERGNRLLSGDSDGAPPAHWLTVGTGAGAVLAAATLIWAANSALLHLDGAPPDDTVGGALSPAGPPLLVAAIPLLVAGVLALIRPAAQLGRAAVAVVWAGVVYAFGQALLARSLVLSTAGDPISTGHSWTSGPGLWLMLLGTLLALVAAVLAGVTARRVAQASLEVVDDTTLDVSRLARRWPAVGLTAVIVIALSLPVHRDLTGASSTLVNGYDLDTWGLWALAIGSIGAVWVAAYTRRAGIAAALLVAAAAVVGQPLVVPAVVRAAPGFELSIGFWAGVGTVVILVLSALYFAQAAGRVRSSRPLPLGAATPGAARTGKSARTTTAAKGGN
ncbi:MAG: hypothetical protein ABWZ02_02140 [Nakamurella sp.]